MGDTTGMCICVCVCLYMCMNDGVIFVCVCVCVCVYWCMCVVITVHYVFHHKSPLPQQSQGGPGLVVNVVKRQGVPQRLAHALCAEVGGWVIVTHMR